MSPLMLEAPPALRRAWGEETTDVFVTWLGGVISERAIPRDEHRQIVSRLEILEHDIADLKGGVRDLHREMNERFDRMNERFDRMNERFDEMNVRMEKRFDEMNVRMEKRFDEMNTRSEKRFDEMHYQMLAQTRWLIGSLALIGTVVSVLLAIAQFTH